MTAHSRLAWMIRTSGFAPCRPPALCPCWTAGLRAVILPRMGMPVVLDCDNSFGLRGGDIGDGLALLCLLASRTVDLIGITTCFGSAPADVVFRETRRLVGVLGREEIPVFHGAPWSDYRPTEAAHFLARTARERPGELTIVATGPLANLRAASEVSRGFFAEVGRIVCSGGCTGRPRLGWRRVRESNFSSDPRAALAVLSSRRPLTVLTGELCAQSPFRRKDFSGAGEWPTWARRAVRRWAAAGIVRAGSPWLPLWDLLPAAYIVRSDLFEDRTRHCVSGVEELAAGSLRLSERVVGPPLNVPVRVRAVGTLREHVLGLIDTAMKRRPMG